MSEMVERVARAIHPCWWADGLVGKFTPEVLEAFRADARAKAHDAIAAMREPTRGMIREVRYRAAERRNMGSNYRGPQTFSVEDRWKMMIDEALKGN